MVHAVHDGGGYVPTPRNEAQEHTFRSGDTLTSLADRYGVTPQAIREANPAIFQDNSAIRRMNAQETGSVIYTGEAVNIPPAPMSVTDDPIDVGNPGHGGLDREVNVDIKGDAGGGGISWNPDGGSVTLSAKQAASIEGGQPGRPGYKVEAGREGAVTLSGNTSDGNTTFSAEARVTDSVSAEGRGRPGTVEGEYSVGAGFTASYQVTLPGENRDVSEAVGVNPFDPTTIPVGGSVTLDSSAFTETAMAGSFRYIGTETDIEQSAGVSYTVERVDEDTVSVVAGPTEAIEAFNGVGVRAGDLSVMLGRQDNLSGANFSTAQFDISTPDGQAAYEHFNATGQVAHETPGVSNVATVSRVDYASQTQLRGELGPISGSLGGPENTGSLVQTTFPDGSYALNTQLQYSGNVPLEVVQRFDASGTEVLSERSYAFEIDTAHDNDSVAQSHADLLNWSLTGGGSGTPVSAGDKVTLTFSEDQMSALRQQTRDTVDGMEMGGNDLRLLVGGEHGAPVNDNMEFAIAMARNIGGTDYGFVERLFNISSGADGDIANRDYERIMAQVESTS
ncbi:LysM peptidoglycan-binding domain-containing protein [Luteimonas abyssi]|uniref:LysM peptidoglycan-binding domain-containing protein n=1 Tax=Luteimonas abyssi TaxID=1247514 RepID=UPI000737B0E0|nr:LysM domain-containing protein [Luteimonas abyssi]